MRAVGRERERGEEEEEDDRTKLVFWFRPGRLDAVMMRLSVTLEEMTCTMTRRSHSRLDALCPGETTVTFSGVLRLCTYPPPQNTKAFSFELLFCLVSLLVGVC